MTLNTIIVILSISFIITLLILLLLLLVVVVVVILLLWFPFREPVKKGDEDEAGTRGGEEGRGKKRGDLFSI